MYVDYLFKCIKLYLCLYFLLYFSSSETYQICSFDIILYLYFTDFD